MASQQWCRATASTRKAHFPSSRPTCRRSTLRPFRVRQSVPVASAGLPRCRARNSFKWDSWYGMPCAKKTSFASAGNWNVKDFSQTASMPSQRQVLWPSTLLAGPRGPMTLLPVNWKMALRPAAPRTRKAK